MACPDHLRARILAQPSRRELARRRRVIEATRQLQAVITPLTVPDLRRIARAEEEAAYGQPPGMDP